MNFGGAMARTEELFRLKFVTDTETELYSLGEIDGFPRQQIFEYLERFGEKGCDELRRIGCQLIQMSENKRTRLMEQMTSRNSSRMV